jgi:hypothetical protein
VVLAALEDEMADQVSNRRQAPDMTPGQTPDQVPNDQVPNLATPRGAMLGGDLQAHIGRQLRAVYDEVANEAVPDRFLKLIEELERKEANNQ